MRAPSLYSNRGASSRSLLPPGPTLSSQYIRTAIVPRRAAATALRQQQRPRHRPFMTRGARGPAQDPDATPTPPPPPRRRRLARRVPSPRGACGNNPCPGGSLLSDAPNHRIGSQRESATADDERRCAMPQGDRHREQQQLPRHRDDRRRGAEQPTWRHLRPAFGGSVCSAHVVARVSELRPVVLVLLFFVLRTQKQRPNSSLRGTA